MILYSPKSWLWRVAVAGVNVVILSAAREHVGSYWKGKAKIPLPGMSEHNEAITRTQETRLNSLYLAGSWVLAGVLGFLV